MIQTYSLYACFCMISLLFFFELYGDHRYLHVRTHSFPTRRSSDLMPACNFMVASALPTNTTLSASSAKPGCIRSHLFPPTRSEEHTSELQSLMRISYAVF